MTSQQIVSQIIDRIRQRVSERTQQGKSPAIAATRAQAHPLATIKFRSDQWPIPNIFLRTSLFPATSNSAHPDNERRILAAPGKLIISVAGKQLSQADLDLFGEVARQFFLAIRENPQVQSICVSPRTLLIGISRGDGSAQYRWLAESLERLASIELDAQLSHGVKFSGRILHVSRDQNGRFTLALPRSVATLYYEGWTAICPSVRAKLRRKPLALWLQGWVSTHAKPFKVTYGKFQHWCGSSNQQEAGFNRRLRAAAQELVRVGCIKKVELHDNSLHLDSIPSPSQLRHLKRRGIATP